MIFWKSGMNTFKMFITIFILFLFLINRFDLFLMKVCFWLVIERENLKMEREGDSIKLIVTMCIFVLTAILTLSINRTRGTYATLCSSWPTGSTLWLCVGYHSMCCTFISHLMALYFDQVREVESTRVDSLNPWWTSVGPQIQGTY